MHILPRSSVAVKLAHGLPCFILCLLIIGCGSEKRVAISRDDFALAPQVEAARAPAAAANPAKAGDKPANAVVRKVISTARVELITDDFDKARQQIEELISQPNLTKLGGLVTQSEVNGSIGNQRHALWVVRLPPDHVESFLERVSAVGQLVQSVSGAQDVTDQFVDLSARVTNKQKEEARLLSHLELSGKLEDTLALEKELSRVREEIERIQGQLNVLAAASDLATITIRLQEQNRYEPPSKLEPTPFLTAISNSFVGSYRKMVEFFQGVAIILAALAPWILPAIVLGVPTIWGLRVYFNLTPQRRPGK